MFASLLGCPRGNSFFIELTRVHASLGIVSFKWILLGLYFVIIRDGLLIIIRIHKKKGQILLLLRCRRGLSRFFIRSETGKSWRKDWRRLSGREDESHHHRSPLSHRLSPLCATPDLSLSLPASLCHGQISLSLALWICLCLSLSASFDFDLFLSW